MAKMLATATGQRSQDININTEQQSKHMIKYYYKK